jgi:hypothetical protein
MKSIGVRFRASKSPKHPLRSQIVLNRELITIGAAEMSLMCVSSLILEESKHTTPSCRVRNLAKVRKESHKL